MVMERMPEGPPATAAVSTDATTAARALRMQILATEHWSLLATRSLTWNEAFARAGMFLTLLSGAIVALALVAQATALGEGFVLFAVMILPVVLFLGLATYVRLLEINNEDYVWVRGMNRLRGAYLEMDPGLAQYFVTGTTEDAEGIFRTFGSMPEAPGNLETGFFHAFVTTPATIAFVDAMLAAVLSAIIALQFHAAMAPASLLGVGVFLVTFVALGAFAYRNQVMAKIYVTTRVSDGEASAQGNSDSR
ncbi:MAG: hypothetical protein M3P32_05565 [Chloroflexota bacterium]|nr:hypothetical protein [Chloroflexota bacterium]